MDVGLWDRLGYIAIISAIVIFHHRFKARWKRPWASGTDYIARAATATLWLNLIVALVTFVVWLASPATSAAMIQRPGYMFVAAVSFTFVIWLIADLAAPKVRR